MTMLAYMSINVLAIFELFDNFTCQDTLVLSFLIIIYLCSSELLQVLGYCYLGYSSIIVFDENLTVGDSSVLDAFLVFRFSGLES